MRWNEQSLVRQRTDSSRGELDVKIMSAKPSRIWHRPRHGGQAMERTIHLSHSELDVQR
jgi:hypothetical protein